jgi:hypothetical protein
MKYENIDEAKRLCELITGFEQKISDLQKLKTTGTLRILGKQDIIEVFLGKEMADWIVSRAILKYKGRLLELHAELSKL